MSDSISRQAAIDALGEEPMVWTDEYYEITEREQWRRDVAAIEAVPSAEPRKKGEWVRNFDGNEWYWFCSNCKEEWYEEDLWMGGNDFPNFCPNCGSYNGGEQE